MLGSDIPAWAYDTPTKLWVRVPDPAGGNQYVLAKTSKNQDRHDGREPSDPPPLSPCTDAEAMLINEDIHPRLCGYDTDLGHST